METGPKDTPIPAEASSSRSEDREALTRRAFLKQAAFATAAMAAPFPVLADPYAPQSGSGAAAGVLPDGQVRPVRVTGRVLSGKAGLAGVAVTDGLTVTATDAEGRFEIVSNTLQSFVSITTPDGYAIGQNPSGTAAFYQPIMPNDAGEMAARFDLASQDGSDDRHGFLVLSDPQTQDAYEMDLFHAETVPDVRETAAALAGRSLFGVGCGDIMFDDLTLYPEYERGVRDMGMPFFQVVGNHDLDFGPTDDGSVRTFCRHFGPNYYSFDRGEVHYIVLDNVFWHGEGYIGYVTDDQLNWLVQDLALIEPGRTVAVFNHIPQYNTRHIRTGDDSPSISSTTVNRERMYRLLEPYKAHVFSGHVHEHEHIFEGGVHEIVQGTVCGAWWSGPICWDGTPNGYGVYEVDGSDIRWRYKSTGLGEDHQMRVYLRGADPGAPDEIVANVWDWDPEWRVVWYEDGMRRGAMARRPGTDPLSESLHRGSDLPERRPWVEPKITNHLFYAPVSPEAGKVVVEATDRFGRTYASELG